MKYNEDSMMTESLYWYANDSKMQMYGESYFVLNVNAAATPLSTLAQASIIASAGGKIFASSRFRSSL